MNLSHGSTPLCLVQVLFGLSARKKSSSLLHGESSDEQQYLYEIKCSKERLCLFDGFVNVV